MSRTAIVAGAVAAITIAAGFTLRIKYDDWFVFPKTRQMVADQLVDPLSAQFRNDWIAKDGWHCGEVNAKNGMGGYGGFKRFIAGQQNKIIYLEGVGMLGDTSHEEWMAILDKQIAFNENWAKNREKYAELGLRLPPESERREKAKAEVFEDHWKAICEASAITS
ncbi:hypothetical protein GTP38_11150 [Duganella sp. FT94W]|uniref:Uncharacterized protein n=1 Tax=Duganella lactea TaxID=2692173 RepID=A0ABW9V5B9_9BURK|nr:hypothetical protein [Duganella lactea]MYM34896.1 hypothetical protein [Duganella lactea]